jgi:hypothetical protein
MQTTQSHSCSRGALLAGAAVLAALAFAAPGQALAASCGGTTGASTGTHAPSAGMGGISSGSHPSAGSTGSGSSCGVNATKSASSGGGLAPSLAGVHNPGAITGNGGKRNGSTTSSRTASTVTTVSSTHTASVAGGTHTAGGAHFSHRRP